MHENYSQPEVDFKKKRDLGSIINATFAFLRQEIKPLGRAVLKYVGPFFLIAAIFGAYYQSSVFGNLGDMLSGVKYGSNYLENINWRSLVGLLITSVLGSAAAMTTVYAYISLYTDNGGNSVNEDNLWTFIQNKFFTVLGTMILLYLIFFGIVLGVSLIGGLLQSPGLSIFLILGAMFYIIYLVFRWAFVFIIRIHEGISFSESLKRSSYLIKENWWVTFGVIFLVYLIVMAIGSFFGLIQMLMNLGAGMNNIGDISMVSLIVTTITTFAASLLGIIPMITIALQYFNLVEQKDNTGLINRIKEIREEENNF